MNILMFSDTNECLDGTHHCHRNAECRNVEGSYTCICKPGYNGDGRTCYG